VKAVTAARNVTLAVLLAVGWMVLQDAYGLGTFLTGVLVGALILWAFPAPVHGLIRPYVRRPGGFLRWLYHAAHLLLYYGWQWILGNLQMARLLLRPKLEIAPGILKFPLRARQPAQVALLASLITLTPGTLTLDVADDYGALYIHVVDASDPEAALESCRRIEDLVMEVLQ